MTLLELIEDIHNEKKKARRFPTYALRMEILSRKDEIKLSVDDITKQLKILVKQKNVAWGDTINDFYFKLI